MQSELTGILLIDKQRGWTSHDVVARARHLLGTRKVGHAGTLDPMATGLLVLGVGRATKLLQYLTGVSKVYEATICLGSSTVTDDAEGDVVSMAMPRPLAAVTDDDIRGLITRELVGDIDQVPSAVSAIKVQGQRAYALVRSERPVDLPARHVRISRFDVQGIRRSSAHAIEVDAVVACSSGTYIRALARDLGSLLGVGGHLSALRRTSVGPFAVADAVVLPGHGESAPHPPVLMSMLEAAQRVMPIRRLARDEIADIAHGRPISANLVSGEVAGVDEHGAFVGVVVNKSGRARARFMVAR